MQLHAQWESPFTHYWEIKNYYNPSFAGEKDQISTAAVYRSQLSDIKNRPQRILITADMPFEFLQRKHGVGVVVYSESINRSINYLLASQYSFKQQLGEGMLNIGIQAGVYNLKHDAGSTILITDTLQNNPYQYINFTDKQVPSLTSGISWTDNKLYVGVSIMHLNQPRFYILPKSDSDSIISHIPRTYNFIAGYNIPLFNSLEIQPIVWLLHDDNQTQTQATLRLNYDNRFSGGFTLISDAGYSLFAGINTYGFRLGYAYTSHNKKVKKEMKGYHEMFIRYDFALDSFKPKLQPHKSIRLL